MRFDKPGGLSVDSQLNVVVAWPYSHNIRVYTPGGQLIHNITLHSDFTHIHQAIQLDDDRFVIAHGDQSWLLHRVCIVNKQGTILSSFGGPKGSDLELLNGPYRMLLVGDSLIVADNWNYRLLLFNVTSWTYTRELLSTRSSSLMPTRLAISEDYTQLFVSLYYTRSSYENVQRDVELNLAYESINVKGIKAFCRHILLWNKHDSHKTV
jgi:hypothetical protein